MANRDLQITGGVGGGGGGGGGEKKFLGPSSLSLVKNDGGAGPPGPLPWIRNWNGPGTHVITLFRPHVVCLCYTLLQTFDSTGKLTRAKRKAAMRARKYK